MMEKVVEMADSDMKRQLTLTMAVDRLNTEREMAKYRATIIAVAFNPGRKLSALKKN